MIFDRSTVSDYHLIMSRRNTNLDVTIKKTILIIGAIGCFILSYVYGISGLISGRTYLLTPARYSSSKILVASATWAPVISILHILIFGGFAILQLIIFNLNYSKNPFIKLPQKKHDKKGLSFYILIFLSIIPVLFFLMYNVLYFYLILTNNFY